MAGTTPRLGYWFPDGTDPISGGDDGLRSLTADLDASVGTIAPFADAAARDAAITTPYEGQHAWLIDVGELSVYTGGSWQRPYAHRFRAEGLTADVDITTTGAIGETGTRLLETGIRYFGAGHGQSSNVIGFGFNGVENIYFSVDGGARVRQLANQSSVEALEQQVAALQQQVAALQQAQGEV